MKQYEVTKLFTKGILKGLTHTEVTSVNFTLNKQYGNYKVINLKEV